MPMPFPPVSLSSATPIDAEHLQPCTARFLASSSSSSGTSRDGLPLKEDARMATDVERQILVLE